MQRQAFLAAIISTVVILPAGPRQRCHAIVSTWDPPPVMGPKSWNDPGNWDTGIVPDAAADVAIFGDGLAFPDDAIVAGDAPITIGKMRFES